jgi:hypothetical protein
MNNETMILSGEGYSLTITPEAEIAKAKLLDAARAVSLVRDNDESADAAFHMRSLAGMRIAVDKSRKEIKEPVLRIGKLIDSTAKNFLDEIEFEEIRIRSLIGNHANEVARIAAIKAEEERQAFAAARAAREAAAAAQDAADASGRMSDVIAAKQAESARLDALQARMAASSDMAAAKIAEGVRFVWDFEIVSIESVYQNAPDLVALEIKRADVLAWFRELGAADHDVAAAAAVIGIDAFKKPVVSTR